jgi:hypothetical protein
MMYRPSTKTRVDFRIVRISRKFRFYASFGATPYVSYVNTHLVQVNVEEEEPWDVVASRGLGNSYFLLLSPQRCDRILVIIKQLSLFNNSAIVVAQQPSTILLLFFQGVAVTN